MAEEVDQAISRMQSHKGILGAIVADENGALLKTSIKKEDANLATQYSVSLRQLADKARNCVRDLDPGNDLTFLRVRSKKNEIMVAPAKDFTLLVIQNMAE